MTGSQQERIADTVQFFPHYVPFPAVTTEDLLRQAAQDIVAILHNTPKNLPALQAGDETKNALLKIAHLLNRATRPPKNLIPPAPAATLRPPRVRVIPADRPAPIENPVIPAPLPRVQVPNQVPPLPRPHRMIL